MDQNAFTLIMNAINDNGPDLENLLINEYISSKCYDIQYAQNCIELLLHSVYTNRDVFETLIKYINVDIKGIYQETALMSSIVCEDRISNDDFNDYSDHVLFILKYVRDINLLNDQKNNALQLYLDIICDNNLDLDNIKIKVISKMLELGADIFNMNEDDHSAIHSIVWTNNYDLTKFTLDNYINRGNSHIPISLLHYVIYRGRSYDIVELLLRYILDINELNENGRNTMWYINNSDLHLEIKELLIEHGAR